MNLDAWIAEGEDDVEIIGRNSQSDGNDSSRSTSPKMTKQESRKFIANNNNNNNNNSNLNAGNIPQPSTESQKVLQNARDFRVTFLGKPFEMVR